VVFGHGHDIVGAKASNDRLARFMPLDLDDVSDVPVPVNAVERGLADLWRRTAPALSASGRAELRRAIEITTESWLWEAANIAQNRIPDPVDYVEMRRKTFGSDLTIALARFGHDRVVPPDVFRHRTLHELDTAAQDCACMINDLFSYQKEIEFEGDVHNLVLVVESFFDVDRLTARDIVVRLMTERMRQFEHIVADDLAALFEDLQLDAPQREALTRHVELLQDWMSGILEWHRRCVRYQEAELRRHGSLGPSRSLLLLPTGLGTSAVRPPALTAPT
jgi:germacradienol/geosmin synthase